MSTDRHDGAAVRIPPPLVYAGAILLGGLLQRFALDLSLPLLRVARVALTVSTGLAGVGLMAAAAGLFRETGQNPKPWTSTPEIIQSGVYRFTRNPMYVGMALIQAAIGFGFANGWVVVLIAPVLVVVYATAIRKEEAYLAEKFGDAYARYRSNVRRWL